MALRRGLGIDGMACFKGPSPKPQICKAYLRVKSPQTQQPQKSKSRATSLRESKNSLFIFKPRATPEKNLKKNN